MSQSKGSEDEQTSSAAQTWTGSSPYGGKGVGKSKGKSEAPKGLIGARAAKGSKGGDRMFRSEGLSVETQRDILTTMVKHRDLRIAELEAEVAELKEAIAKQGATMMDVTHTMNRLTERLLEAVNPAFSP